MYHILYLNSDGKELASFMLDCPSLKVAAQRAANREIPREAARIVVSLVKQEKAPMQMQGRGPLSRT